MRTKNFLYSYHESTAQQYLSAKKPLIKISSEIKVQYNWIDDKRTDEVQDINCIFPKKT